MNYLLQDMPKYQMVEVEQINFALCLIAIIGGMSILYAITNMILLKKQQKIKKKEGGMSNEENI